MWPRQQDTPPRQRREKHAALRPKWAEARLHTAPCLRVFDRILSIAFDLAPAVLYVAERTFMFALLQVIDEPLWIGVHLGMMMLWWFALSLYIYFGSVEDLTVLVWIRRRAFPIRLFICVVFAPIVPVVVFVVSFRERTSFSCLDESSNTSSPRADRRPNDEVDAEKNVHLDEVVAPQHHTVVASSLAEDVGQGRINIEEMPPDLWLSLMYSFVSTRLNLQLAESTPGHRLFLFSVMTGSIPVVIWLLIMHAVTPSNTASLTAAYFVAVITVWCNSYRLCRTMSLGAFGFFMALIQIDVLTAGYNLEQLIGSVADGRKSMSTFTWIWIGGAGVLGGTVVILFVIDSFAQLRFGRLPKRHRARFIISEVAVSLFRLCAMAMAIPAIALTTESLKLSTAVILDAIQRPAPEFTPSLAGLLSFVFRHTGKDGDTHDARTKHVMLAAARARKEQLIRMARDAPGGEVSPAAISMFKVCSCIEGVASDPDTKAIDLFTHDTVADLRDGLSVDQTVTEPELTRRRCLRAFSIVYVIHAVFCTLLPFIDVWAGSTAWSDWAQGVFLLYIALGILAAAICTPAFVRYAKFRLETRRLTQLCPSSRELDTAWLQWVQSYHAQRPPVTPPVAPVGVRSG